MGRIQSSVGLISGIPVQDTIDKLMTLAARPRTILETRVADLKAQKLAVTELTALVIGVEFAMQRLGSKDLFAKTSASVSNKDILAATITGSPAVGSFVYTPLRKAQSHQLLSQGFATKSEPIGSGEVTVQFGGFVDKGLRLDDLNGGAGVQRGKIRITDRSGANAVVDLRTALTIDDVLNAINQQDGIQVTATAEGDRIKLTDDSGQTLSNLRVQEVGASTTAADLGLGGINVSSNEALGADILNLTSASSLQLFRDGNGVSFRKGAADLHVTHRDGTVSDIDFLALKKPATQSSATTDAKNGLNAQIKLTSVGTGEAYDGYKLVFQDDAAVVAGDEKVTVDGLTKIITVKIDAGNTRAAHVVSKLNADSSFSARFTASHGDGGNGTGAVDVADTLTTAGGAIEYYNETTVGDVIDTINRANPTKLLARISASGDSLELVDLTVGSDPFAVSSLFGGRVAEELGFTSPASGDVISGERRVAGLKTVLLDSLAGGYGIGELGTVAVTNRNGTTTNVDLSAAKTLADVVQQFNAAGAGVTARLNDARNGLLLTDTTGGTSNLVIANGDASTTADKLKIVANVAKSTVNSGTLGLQTFNASQTLASLRNGRGISTGSFLISDTNGNSSAVNLSVLAAKTVGDVIDNINGLGIGVEARVNETGDGLVLIDTAGGSGQITVTDVGSGTAAKDLKIAGSSIVKTINGNPTKVIDGSYTTRITLAADDSLEDLVQKLNDADGDFSASVLNSGGGTNPYRLVLNSGISGSRGELLFDGSAINMSFQETGAAQDALIMTGSLDAPVLGALIASPNNDFAGLIDGVQVSVLATSNAPQTVTIDRTADGVVSQVKLFVDQYNKLQAKMNEVASFNAEDNTSGVLFSSNEMLQIELEFGSVLGSRHFSAGSFQSIESIGLSPDAQGQLQFNEDKFRAVYQSNRESVEQFLTTASSGLSAKFVAAAERLAGRDQSVLMNRSSALQRTIDSHTRQIQAINTTLTRQREQLVKQFARLETVIGNMQSKLNWLSSVQPMRIASNKK